MPIHANHRRALNNMTAFDGFDLPTGAKLEEKLKVHASATVEAIGARAVADCSDAEFHGNPFRYCSCGWIEEAPVPTGGNVETEPTLEDKVNYIFGTMKLLEENVIPLLSQVGPLVEQAAPLLASFAPLAAKANSPLGRIAGSLFG
jgi:hypothetical protein